MAQPTTLNDLQTVLSFLCSGNVYIHQDVYCTHQAFVLALEHFCKTVVVPVPNITKEDLKRVLTPFNIRLGLGVKVYPRTEYGVIQPNDFVYNMDVVKNLPPSDRRKHKAELADASTPTFFQQVVVRAKLMQAVSAAATPARPATPTLVDVSMVDAPALNDTAATSDADANHTDTNADADVRTARNAPVISDSDFGDSDNDNADAPPGTVALKALEAFVDTAAVTAASPAPVPATTPASPAPVPATTATTPITPVAPTTVALVTAAVSDSHLGKRTRDASEMNTDDEVETVDAADSYIELQALVRRLTRKTQKTHQQHMDRLQQQLCESQQQLAESQKTNMELNALLADTREKAQGDVTAMGVTMASTFFRAQTDALHAAPAHRQYEKYIDMVAIQMNLAAHQPWPMSASTQQFLQTIRRQGSMICCTYHHTDLVVHIREPIVREFVKAMASLTLSINRNSAYPALVQILFTDAGVLCGLAYCVTAEGVTLVAETDRSSKVQVFGVKDQEQFYWLAGRQLAATLALFVYERQSVQV